MIFEAGDVVVVPFPFTDRTAAKRRPALVLSGSAPFGDGTGQSVLAMITSAKESAWPLDIVIADRAPAGLDSPCAVRMKLFTLDNRLILRRVGAIGLADRSALAASISALFGLLAGGPMPSAPSSNRAE